MIDQGYINFYFGEVVESQGTYSRKDVPNTNILFPIDVKVRQNNNTKTITNVKPIFTNFKQIPVVGETVLIFQGYDHTTTHDRRYHQWYYFPTIGIQSGVNSNVLPINSQVFVPDSRFVERSTPILQPYAGDLLIEGRYGNTIRLSSTIKTDGYDNDPTWSGSDVTDPIIVISNTTEVSTDKKYIVEDIENDASSLYLTTTQKLNKLKLSTELRTYNKFSGSQLVGVADRIILRAKKDVAILDSERGIVLNTPNEIRLGDDHADISLVHGDVLIKILQKLINQLQQPIQCGTMVGSFINKSALNQAQRELQNLQSSKYFIMKNTY